jgi:SagB-type dehydrogenase family enzyme
MFRRALLLVLLTGLLAIGDGPGGMLLPSPDKTGGKPLMQALSERKSNREFRSEKLPLQILSNLLWAAYGVNRPDGKRTAPSAMNRQTVEIYVVMMDGAYRYNAGTHGLEVVTREDLRTLAGMQTFAAEAPLNLVYVADFAKMAKSTESDKLLYTAYETGSIGQNVSLYCASEGLATVVRASVDRASLAKALGLKAEQRITLAQSVGYPKRDR